jgi:hypothetical protein
MKEGVDMRSLIGAALVLMLVACGSGTKIQPHTSAEVVKAFVDAGLEATTPTPIAKGDQGLAPVTEREGTRFLIPSLGADMGGRVFTFATQGDLDAKKKYYDDLGKGSSAFFSWTFAKNLVLVQINGALPEAKAWQYQDALNRTV